MVILLSAVINSVSNLTSVINYCRIMMKKDPAMLMNILFCP